jgi:hypothetical protein
MGSIAERACQWGFCNGTHAGALLLMLACNAW